MVAKPHWVLSCMCVFLLCRVVGEAVCSLEAGLYIAYVLMCAHYSVYVHA